VIACEVSPVLNRYDDPELAVSTTDPPWQNVVPPPAVIVAIAVLVTVTATGALAREHPLALVTVTV
jgi:hypothetical protein